MKPLVIHAEAEAELDDAIGYYEAQVPGLGLDLESQVRAGLLLIQAQPQQRPFYKRTAMRKHLIVRFSYAIFYREYADHISVVAIAHGSRRPGYWRGRTAD